MKASRAVRSLSLKARLLVCGTCLSVLPLIFIGTMLVVQQGKMTKVVQDESTALTYQDLDHVVESVYSMCKNKQEQVDASIQSAEVILNLMGEISLEEEKVRWNATDQYSKKTVSVDLPRMLVDGKWLGQNRNVSELSPVVDEIRNVIGGSCTIFQRMNPQGDMLRISTNIEGSGGERAIGTYIPAVRADGTPDPVVSTVLSGKTYRGRAYAVNQWYITAYTPLFDDMRQVIGILFVGYPERSYEELRRSIMNVKLGETGYMYVLDSSGNYIVSQGGRRDGENILDARDSNGKAFVENIISTATRLDADEIGELRYLWKDQQGNEREKVARLKYLEQWDWIIGSSYYVDELEKAQQNIEGICSLTCMILMGTLLFSFVVSVVVWILVPAGSASGCSGS